MRKQWKENLGLEFDIDLVSAKQFMEKRNNDSSHLRDGVWSPEYPDPDSFLRVLLPWQRTGWRTNSTTS